MINNILISINLHDGHFNFNYFSFYKYCEYPCWSQCINDVFLSQEEKKCEVRAIANILACCNLPEWGNVFHLA